MTEKVSKDDLGCHAAKGEGEGQAEEDQVVLSTEGGVWRESPSGTGGSEDQDGSPFEENGENREVLLAAGLDNIFDTGKKYVV